MIEYGSEFPDGGFEKWGRKSNKILSVLVCQDMVSVQCGSAAPMKTLLGVRSKGLGRMLVES